MIRRGVNPQVGSCQSQLRGALLYTRIETEMGHGGWDPRNSARAWRDPGASGGRSGSKSIPRPGIADQVPARSSRPSCMRTPTARWLRGRAGFHELGAEGHLPAGRFDEGCGAGGQAGGSAHRETGAFEIVRRDDGVDGKTALPRRQAVIAPLRRKDAGQFTVVGVIQRGRSEVVRRAQRRKAPASAALPRARWDAAGPFPRSTSMFCPRRTARRVM